MEVIKSCVSGETEEEPMVKTVLQKSVNTGSIAGLSVDPSFLQVNQLRGMAPQPDFSFQNPSDSSGLPVPSFGNFQGQTFGAFPRPNTGTSQSAFFHPRNRNHRNQVSEQELETEPESEPEPQPQIDVQTPALVSGTQPQFNHQSETPLQFSPQFNSQPQFIAQQQPQFSNTPHYPAVNEQQYQPNNQYNPFSISGFKPWRRTHLSPSVFNGYLPPIGHSAMHRRSHSAAVESNQESNVLPESEIPAGNSGRSPFLPGISTVDSSPGLFSES